MTQPTNAQEVVRFLNSLISSEATATLSPTQLNESLHLATDTFQYQGRLMDIHQGPSMDMKGPQHMCPEQEELLEPMNGEQLERAELGVLTTTT